MEYELKNLIKNKISIVKMGTLNDYMNLLSERNKFILQEKFSKILSEYDPTEILFLDYGYSFHEIGKKYYYKDGKYFLVENESSWRDDKNDYWHVKALTKDQMNKVILPPTREESSNAYKKEEHVRKKWKNEIDRLKSQIKVAEGKWSDEISRIRSQEYLRTWDDVLIEAQIRSQES